MATKHQDVALARFSPVTNAAFRKLDARIAEIAIEWLTGAHTDQQAAVAASEAMQVFIREVIQ